MSDPSTPIQFMSDAEIVELFHPVVTNVSILRALRVWWIKRRLRRNFVAMKRERTLNRQGW